MTDDEFYALPKPRWPLQEELAQPPVSALTSAEVAALRDMSLEEAAQWIVERLRGDKNA